jgi:hypothetical protein
MKPLMMLLVLVWSLIGIAVSYSFASPLPPVNGRDSFYLSDDKLQKLKSDALGGSVSAANRLVDYFLYYEIT